MDKLKAMAEALGTGVKNQWDKGRPFREMMGAALTGNFGDVGNIAKDYAATVNPQDLNEGIMNAGMGFAPMGIAGTITTPFKTASTKQMMALKDAFPIGGAIENVGEQFGRFPNKAVISVTPDMTIRSTADGKYLLRNDPQWGSSSKQFYAVGDDINELANAGLDRLKNSNKKIVAAQKAKFDSSLMGKLQSEFGDNFSTAKSTQSKSEYLIHNPTGTKIRISDHDLPLHYEQPDVNLSINQPIEEKLMAIRNALK